MRLVAPTTSVAELTDDELCASYCKGVKCVFGNLPTPYDECLKDCKGLITVDTCAEFERPLVVCQVRTNDCRGCPTEFRAVDDCGQHCAELQMRGETLPEHRKNLERLQREDFDERGHQWAKNGLLRQGD